MIGLIKGTARQLKTVSGLPLPIASYKSNSRLPIQELSLSINPTQSGSGDPAPDNIRPITGVSSVNVARTGASIVEISDKTGSINNGYFSSFTTGYTLQADVTYTLTMVVNTTVEPFAISVGVGDGSSYRADIAYTQIVNRNGVVSITFTPTSTQLQNWNVLWFRAPRYSTPQELHPTTCTFTITNISLVTSVDTYLIQLGDTYYGATLDVVRGKLRVTHWLDEYDGSNDEGWSIYSSSGLRYSYYINRSHTQPAISSLDKWKTNSIPVSGSSENTPEDANRITCRGTFYSSKNLYIFAPPTDIPNLTALRAYLSNQPFQFWYPTTPIEVDLTPTQINSLLGSNNIWHDENGNVEILKFMDRQLYFGR